jgi:hypothetical protein
MGANFPSCAARGARASVAQRRGKPNGLILLHVVAGFRNNGPGTVRKTPGKSFKPPLAKHPASAALHHQDGTRQLRRQVSQFCKLAKDRREIRAAAPVGSPREAVRTRLEQMLISI